VDADIPAEYAEVVKLVLTVAAPLEMETNELNDVTGANPRVP
jgi:hypothetical protein